MSDSTNTTEQNLMTAIKANMALAGWEPCCHPRYSTCRGQNIPSVQITATRFLTKCVFRALKTKDK